MQPLALPCRAVPPALPPLPQLASGSFHPTLRFSEAASRSLPATSPGLASTCYGTESAERRDDGPAATNVTDIDYGKGNGERGGEVEWGVYAVNVLNDGRDPRNIVVTVWCLSIVCCHIW